MKELCETIIKATDSKRSAVATVKLSLYGDDKPIRMQATKGGHSIDCLLMPRHM